MPLPAASASAPVLAATTNAVWPSVANASTAPSKAAASARQPRRNAVTIASPAGSATALHGPSGSARLPAPASTRLVDPTANARTAAVVPAVHPAVSCSRVDPTITARRALRS